MVLPRHTAMLAAPALGLAAAAGLKIGDFGVSDALRIARDTRRGPTLLTLDLTRPLRSESGGLAGLAARGRPTLREVVEAVIWAAGDPDVVGLLARIGDRPGGLATVQELAGAVRHFAATGKPAVAHAEAFGEGANGTVAYLLATAFSEIHVQPTGDVALLGVAGEVTFLRGALDKAGIEPQIDHRHEYKNAADVLTEHGFTPAHREALDGLVDDWASQVTTAIADARGLSVDAVGAAMDVAPLSADEAHDGGLVDVLAYLDESLDDLKGRLPDDITLRPIDDYHTAIVPRRRWGGRRAPVVALIDAAGPITVRAPAGPLSGPTVTSDRLCADLRRAAQDDEIAAVVLRVDSGGGSSVASDAIHREVRRTRRSGTPVIAWMGDMAASGGYYIAMAADRIVAQPGTLTGSIGVFGGKAVSAGLERKLGLHTEAVTRGAHARFYSGTTSFSDSERRRLDRQLDRVYDDFTRKVAEDRGIDRDRVHEIARGRVWTGTQARERGLVDTLGGYREALDAARTALQIERGAPLRVHRYPPRPSVLARMRGQGHPDPATEDVMAALATLPADPAAWLDIARRAAQPAGVLSLPWVPRLR